MTSSLVGSEMCIRDRPGTDKITTHMLKAMAPESTKKMKHIMDKICTEPVSYTHLTLPTICSV
eukprot:11713107-Prorocentrum_lima.AAC.1